MSLIMGEPPRGRDPLRRPVLIPLLVVVTAVVIAVVVAAFLVGLRGPSPAPPLAVGPVAVPVFTWSEVGTSVVPSSPATGPRDRSGFTARGFSHDDLGAAVAAINISARVTGSVPQAVSEATVRAQCFGDLDATQIAASQPSSTTSPDSTRPSEYYFRITGGDPAGDVVILDVAASTPQSRGLGAYVHFSRTLRWSEGDWRMQVPPARAEIVSSLPGYTVLGRP